MCITGEWNGVMTAKWPNGKTEVFVDTRTLPIVKKNVSPISQQEDFESRRLWKELTYHLRTGNVSAATDTKCSIEQRQRDLVKQRQERGEVWQTRVSVRVQSVLVVSRILFCSRTFSCPVSLLLRVFFSLTRASREIYLLDSYNSEIFESRLPQFLFLCL